MSKQAKKQWADSEMAKKMQLSIAAARTASGKATRKKFFPHFVFGKRRTLDELQAMVSEAWNGLFFLEDAYFNGHHWQGTVTYTPTGEQFHDVWINRLTKFMNVPLPLKHAPEVKARRAEVRAQLGTT